MAQYKTVAGPVGLTISQKDSYTDAIKQYAQIINRESVDGWKFHSMYEVPVTKEEINAAMKAATTESYGYTEDEIVSSDIIGMTFGSLFDATQTMVNKLPGGKTQVQVVSWYDNENSYVSQMVRTIKHFSTLL